jgi:CRP/FNR family transcriptional regulator, cyclic AMP receptor protein
MAPDDKSPADDALLARHGRRFPAGTVLFRDGDVADFAFLLQSGRVRLFKQVGAVERSLRVVRPGDLFGESALQTGSIRRTTAVALDEVTAIAVDHATFESLLSSHPTVGLKVLEQVIRRLRDAEEQVEVLMVRDHQSKVVVALMKLAQRELEAGGKATGEVSLKVSPLELSAQVGLEVDAVKRVVAQLRETGYVRIQDERVEVSDLDALRELYALLSLKDQLRGSPQRDRARPSP